MATARKSAGDRKAELVTAAIRLAAEVGPDRVTTQMLADAVGISQPAVFRHFPAKADIWTAVGEEITRALWQEDMGGGAEDPLAALMRLVERNLDHIARSPAIPAILFSRELHVGNEALRRHFESLMQRRRAGFAAIVRQAQARKQIADGIEADDLAALILATIQGLAMRWSLENRGFDLPREGGRLIAALVAGEAG
jgi:AcrR family transcriptional regulator